MLHVIKRGIVLYATSAIIKFSAMCSLKEVTMREPDIVRYKKHYTIVYENT